MRCRFPVKWSQREHRCVFRIEHIEADPIVVVKVSCDCLDDGLLQRNNTSSVFRKSLNLHKKGSEIALRHLPHFPASNDQIVSIWETQTLRKSNSLEYYWE